MENCIDYSIKQENYLSEVFEDEISILNFPEDNTRVLKDSYEGDCTSTVISNDLMKGIRKLSFETGKPSQAIFLAAYHVFLAKYSDQHNIIIGIPLWDGNKTVDEGSIEDILVERNCSDSNEKFKDFLCRVEDNLSEAIKKNGYSIEEIKNILEGKKIDTEDFFKTTFSYSKLDNKKVHEQLTSLNKELRTQISLLVVDEKERIKISLYNNKYFFNENTIQMMLQQITFIIQQIVENHDIRLADIEILQNEEKEKILTDFNNFVLDYPRSKTINVLLEEQAKKTPDNIALSYENKSITYKELNEKANQIAWLLRQKGVEPETVVGIMLKRSINMIASIIAVLKAGGAYLPIDIDLPIDRVTYMLQDSGARMVLTDDNSLKGHPFTALQNFERNNRIKTVVTEKRGSIENFNDLPRPDRSLIDLRKYKDKIGMASVTNSITIQTTRGCPYECLYCHKIWSKNHVSRSAENIYNEIEYYYKNGVTNFAVIDDCFNLNIKNSKELFKLIIRNGLKIQMFFPNGLRGDLLTPEYIDLMVEAGTRGINLSLETASPRLQKMLQKNLDLGKFRNVINYIAEKHPGVVLELASMHGFPSETEEEALMTLNFIKDIKWIHFPYIHILKIFPNTEMEKFALEQGISKEDIMRSRDRAFHELPETLPFPKSFTRMYQSRFMNEYFLDKDRLKQVIPVQMKVMNEVALVQKYNAYLPVEIQSIEDIIKFAQIRDFEIKRDSEKQIDYSNTIFDRNYITKKIKKGAKKILFLDLSQQFSTHKMLYKVVEQPLGQLYLLTYLKQIFGEEIDGRIYKSGVDFDSYKELKLLIDEYKPDLVGIRTLTIFKEFFHEVTASLRQWGVKVPIITGGPYATSDYDTILKDRNVDLVIFGEGEHTLAELTQAMMKNGFVLPETNVLKNISGIAFVEDRTVLNENKQCEIIALDRMADIIDAESRGNLKEINNSKNLAYVMYTSGSTGKSKGVMVEHRQVNNCIFWMQDEFKLSSNDVIVQRTNLSFDPSVWEIFWPLYIGAGIKLIKAEQAKDAEYLISLMSEDNGLSMMYCPASMVTAMTYILRTKQDKPRLRMNWLLIGAEPISKEVVKEFYSYFCGRIVNTYGPTECTINNTYYYVDNCDELSVVPIGRPVANNKIYILSDELHLKPIKVTGEISIAGESVARGYINNLQKTSESFIENPFGEGKLYKTGDLGRWLENGCIEFVGRNDQQVKIRGYRIELGEVKSALLNYPPIKDCAVIVNDDTVSKNKLRTCKRCGITTAYTGVEINDENICDICGNFSKYQKNINEYFKTLDDLKLLIKERNKERKSEYDCLLLYSGGRGAAYALYTLISMGFNILAFTYDNGYFTKSDLENIKYITSKLGVDHITVKYENTDAILKESLNTANTVCKGCFYISSSLAVEYAYKNNINVVIGSTLSRGQIIQNKLYMFYKQGIYDVNEIEKNLVDVQKNAAGIDKDIYSHIDIDVVKNGSAFDKVILIDFYRYQDITNENMIAYLNEKDDYWKKRTTSAIYSTNCPIKQVGDYYHEKTKGFHYYGSATSWEKRLNHINLEGVKADLRYKVTKSGFYNFSRKVGFFKGAEDKIYNKYICAYYVSEQHLTKSDLRDGLSKILPSYMIPSYFIQLDKIPLTSNGKLDKSLLPDIKKISDSQEEYVEPSNEAEMNLAEVWAEVLGVDRVGINDNFFNLGGDSIKAIQIIALIQKYNYKLGVGDLLQYSTIRELCGKIEINAVSEEVFVIEGEVHTTIAQEMLLKKNCHAWQWVILKNCEECDETALRKALDKLLERNDALRIVFNRDKDKLIQYNRGMLEGLYSLEVINISHVQELSVKFQDIAGELNTKDVLNGESLIKAVLFKTDNEDYLMLSVHSLIIDSISWQLLLGEFTKIYKQIKKGGKMELPKKTESFMDWSLQVKEYMESKKAVEETGYWKQVESEMTTELSASELRSFNEMKNGAKIVIELTQSETERLQKNANRAYNTDEGEILLAALTSALKESGMSGKLAVDIEGCGRAQIGKGTNLDRTVGCFAVRYPVVLELNDTGDIADSIKQVKEAIRSVPNNGIWYGILKSRNEADGNMLSESGAKPFVSFRYYGQLDKHIEEGGFEVYGHMICTLVECHVIDLESLVVEERLKLTFNYDAHVLEEKKVSSIVEAFKKNLKKLVIHCEAKEYTEFTPSDMIYNKFSLKEYSELAKYIEELTGTNIQIQNIYPLTPVQERMFMHSLFYKGSKANLVQYSFELDGKIDIELFERSFNAVIDRYEILRTLFTFKKAKQPLQIVLKHRDISIHYEDISHMGQEKKESYIEDFRKNDEENIFNLNRDALMRVSILKTGNDAYKVIWSLHHILVDGWCIEIIYDDIFKTYRALRENTSVNFGPVHPFREYIKWLEKQDKQAALEYWKEYLSKYDKDSSLGKFGKTVTGGNYKREEIIFSLGEEMTKGLHSMAKKSLTTVNTVFQALWGIILQKYNNSDDIVFSMVVSGRPTELNGVEKIVGPFVNTIPVRIKCGEDTAFIELIKQIQQRALLSEKFSYCAMLDIQKNTELKQDMSDNLLVFENYPIGKEVSNLSRKGYYEFVLGKREAFQQTGFKINLIVIPGNEITIVLNYNIYAFDEDFIKRVGENVKDILLATMQNLSIKIKDIEVKR